MNDAHPGGGLTLCAGSAHWDVIGRAAVALGRGEDVPGRVERRAGGVAFNVAAGLAQRGVPAGLCAAVGAGSEGDALRAEIEARGIDPRAIVTVAGEGPGGYVAIENERGELVAAVAGVGAIETHGEAMTRAVQSALPEVETLFLETNLSQDTLTAMAGAARKQNVALVATAVNPATAPRLAPLLHPRIGATIALNLGEANRLLGAAHAAAEAAASALVARGARTAIVTDGAREAASAGPDGVVVRRPPVVTRRTVTGAGDALIAGYVAAFRTGGDQAAALEAGLWAAATQISERASMREHER